MTTTIGQEGSMSITAPPRSIEQRMVALRHANEVRIFRAHIKRHLRAGRLHVRDIVDELPVDEMLATMRIRDLLAAQPRFGHVKVDRLMRQVGIADSKTLAGLTHRQRDELTARLGGEVTT